MKNLIICVICVFIMLALSGCTRIGNPAGQANRDFPVSESTDSTFQLTALLTLKDINAAISREGLQFSNSQDEDLFKYQINGITPVAYSINESSHALLVYIFESIPIRQEAMRDGLDSVQPLLQRDENDLPIPHAMKNVLLIDRVKIGYMGMMDSADSHVSAVIKKIVFNLNDAQQLVFADQGNNWDAQYIVDYYQHWYKDDKDTIRVDQSVNGSCEVKYIGSNPDSLSRVEYTFEVPGGRGSGNLTITKSEQGYYFNIKNRSSSYPSADSICKLTINWHGQEETLQLKTAAD